MPPAADCADIRAIYGEHNEHLCNLYLLPFYQTKRPPAMRKGLFFVSQLFLPNQIFQIGNVAADIFKFVFFRLARKFINLLLFGLNFRQQ